MFKFKKFVLTIALSTQLFATYMYDDPTLGNLAIEGGIWNTELSGNIHNTTSNTSFQDDLGHSEAENISAFGLDLKNDYIWLPNVYLNYFSINHSAYNTLNANKSISSDTFANGSIVTSTIQYSEFNTIIYGYLQRHIFEFDLGINLKRISYSQELKEKSTNKIITIDGPSSVIPLPYIALSIDLDIIDLVLKAEASILAFGDTEASDYRYSINYRVMRHMYMSLGYKHHHWEATSSTDTHEKYDVDLKGNYINIKILF